MWPVLERGARGLVRAAARLPWVPRVIVHPLVARPGYWFASLCGAVWGSLMSRGRLRRAGGVFVASGCPTWSFGRGGTTIGAVFLTRNEPTDAVLAHEAVHRAQWRRFGVALIPLYLAAGEDPLSNRFEIEAGLEDGGYVRRRA